MDTEAVYGLVSKRGAIDPVGTRFNVFIRKRKMSVGETVEIRSTWGVVLGYARVAQSLGAGHYVTFDHMNNTDVDGAADWYELEIMEVA